MEHALATAWFWTALGVGLGTLAIGAVYVRCRPKRQRWHEPAPQSVHTSPWADALADRGLADAEVPVEHRRPL